MSCRINLNMSTDWLYVPYDYENGHLSNADESVFEPVCVPHTNKILDFHKGNDFQNQIDSYRFVSWYRRHFYVDEKYKGKRVYIEFEGVATVADVYVNGKFAGNHKGAYTEFAWDVTDYIKYNGEDNVVAVRVDSTKHRDIPPEGENVDYCLFGGIVRDVNMIIAEPVHIENVHITTPDIKAGNSYVYIEAAVVNSTGKAEERTVEAVIRDKDGMVVAAGTKKATINGNGSFKYLVETTEVSNVKLWDTESPYLYTAQISLKEDERYSDEINTKFGFRYIEFTNNENESKFYLNGKRFTIMGINRHEQWPWIGRAVNRKLQAADADLIKETGINAVRCSHYPQNKAFLDRCDEIGLLVFEEAPGWQHIGDAAWQALYKANIEEMIIRDRNHPSIVSWGVRVNESQDNTELYGETNRLSKALDSTRPVHGSRRREDYDTSECQEDFFCDNYVYPEKPRITPFVITEHSMDWFDGNGIFGATDKKTNIFIRSFAEALNYYYGNDFCAGGFGWSMFDYNNEVNYTQTGHLFYSGIYDIFHYPKPASYLYRAQKDISEEVVLYIANDWTEESTNDVMILSNCDEVELFVNGEAVGKMEPNEYKNLPHPIYVFKDVKYESGELKAIGYVDGKQVKTAIKNTPKEARKLILTPAYDVIEADGADFSFVYVELADENGTILPYANDKVVLSIEGAGKFIGEEVAELEGGHIAFIVQSKYLMSGEIRCYAHMLDDNNVQGGSCCLWVRSFCHEERPKIKSAPETVPNS